MELVKSIKKYLTSENINSQLNLAHSPNMNQLELIWQCRSTQYR